LKSHHLSERTVAAGILAIAAIGLLAARPTGPTCRGARPVCDTIEAAIEELVNSADPVCQMLGGQAALRFRDPHDLYARFEAGDDRFVRTPEPHHQHDDAPSISGVNAVSLGPRLASRIAAHEAAALHLADSLTMVQRCP